MKVLTFAQVKSALQSFGDGQGNYAIRTDFRVQELTDLLNRLANPAVALGKLGGASKSAKKQAASRKNGKLGGRRESSPEPKPSRVPLGRGEGGGE